MVTITLLGDIIIPKEKQAAFVVEFDVIVKKATDATIDIYIQEYTKEDINLLKSFVLIIPSSVR